MKLDTSLLRALTFDCYGTIIDWDGGIRRALRAVPGLAGCDEGELERFLVDRERVEAELEVGPFHPYGRILRMSLQRTAELHGRTVSDAEAADFAAGMDAWPAFADSAQALQRLRTRFELAVLSNVERDVLLASLAPLAVDFAALVTADDVQSYKPATPHFDAGLRALELDPSQVLHVAGSLFHDVRPVRKLGWKSVWVNRRGAPIPSDIDPGDVYSDLTSLAETLVL